MRYFKLFTLLLILLLSTLSFSYAISIDTQINGKSSEGAISSTPPNLNINKPALPKVAVKPAVELNPNKQSVSSGLKPYTINPPKDINNDFEPNHGNVSENIRQSIKLKRDELRNQKSNSSKASSLVIDKNNRIYYARSVTSNNPEYKTRFSIIHNTPSPKRIGGERLYNISDSSFRLSVNKNVIRILDNPVFKLKGINSAKGNYGEIQFLDGAILKIHKTSNRFKGLWDIDGTGERNLKVTPTNLVSGTIPVHFKTFDPKGNIITDEKHKLSFKALAMGPYNGYWTDGIDFSIFLWGMSANKLKSKEMSYIGIDMGIVTQPEIVTNTVEETSPQQESALIPNAQTSVIAPIYNQGGATSAITPFGGNGFAGGGFGGGGFVGGGFGGGFGGGGFGGGGGTPVDPCIANPTLPQCDIDFCKRNPTAPQCDVDFCKRNPTAPQCDADFCKRNPTAPQCDADFCKRNPTAPQCDADFCKRNPTAPQCDADFCKRNPTAPQCDTDFCAKNPTDPQCAESICDIYPSLPQCNPDPCLINPALPECNPDPCVTDPSSPECKPNPCLDDPTLPQCNPDPCLTNPSLPECKPDVCLQDPTLPQCNPDPCIQNPSLPQCTPTTPVSEPFAPLVILLSIFGFWIRKHKNI